MIRARLASLLLIAFLSACGEEGDVAGAQLQADGRPVGGLVMQRLGGGQEAVEAYGGKIIVLNVWATWCAPCRQEMPALDKLASTLDPQRFAVLGLSIDKNPDLAREYLRQTGIRFARHIDPGGADAHRWLDIPGIPKTLIIGPDGRVMAEIVGQRDWADPAFAKWLMGLM